MNQHLKNNIGLVEYCLKQVGRPYWYGTFGQMATKSLHTYKKKQYPAYYTASNYPKQYGMKVHDCIGLIKGYMWCSGPDDMKPKYCSNGFGDRSANGFYNHCTRKGVISTMPDIPGIAVFMNGHVGVYVGNGEVVEARSHYYGTQLTRLKDRPWRYWAYIDEIQYL